VTEIVDFTSEAVVHAMTINFMSVIFTKSQLATLAENEYSKELSLEANGKLIFVILIDICVYL
jgi:hypothetical protein